MKIALIQTNPVIGDFRRNLAAMLDWLARARDRGCDLAVFPELSLCGYPPQDLLERPAFVRGHDLALAELLDKAHGIKVVCGILERSSTPGRLHNSCALLAGGTVVATARKRLLPTYDVFDERRYFEPGEASRPVEIDGRTFGLTVCEDIWNDKDAVATRLYPDDPLEELLREAPGRPEILINIAASPYQLGKRDEKLRIFGTVCRKYRVPLVYVNQVGGQDSLVFDGASFVLDHRGEPAGMAACFREDMLVAEWRSGGWRIEDGGKTEMVAAEPAAEVLAALTAGTADYVRKCGFAKVVLGLSGGIDSALAAVIACRALGPDNVMGIAMPSPYSSPESVEDALQLAENLGIDVQVVPITEAFTTLLATLQPLFGELPADLTEQNLQARIRGLILMAVSNKFNRLLLSTGNKSELAVGYCTLYGDMNGGLAVISDAPKEMVYAMARYVNREREIIPARTLAKPPSAELAPNQRDDDDLPPYPLLDRILTLYLEENLSVAEIVGRGFDPAAVADVVRRINRNEYKRKQAPLGLKVTSKAFGYGRRYPTAQNFSEEPPV
ncbi:MAG: NAD+ synthase [Thermodesulfobacteriota bacterium]